MLTADLVRARPKGEHLVLTELRGKGLARATKMAEQVISIVDAHRGEPRGALVEALKGVEAGPREQKVADGLKKLMLDRCEFEPVLDRDPVELRRKLFERAAKARMDLVPGERFDRGRIVAEVAAAEGLSAEELERGLYGDLKDAHRLLSVAPIAAEGLVAQYRMAQAQAVLLRAEEVVVALRCRSPAAYRALFRRLKFLRLLHRIEPLPDGRHRITIDGPHSMFTASTKYGLKLAMTLPLLRETDHFQLRATVRWGRDKRRLTFETEGGVGEGAELPGSTNEGHLPDEVAELLERFRRRHPDWEVEINEELLELPGIGLCIPDLAFVHRQDGEVVYLEVLGFWSREAVFRRVELLEAGLRHKIVFAVPARLRVSDAILDDELPGALYVYKGKMLPKAIHERLELLRRR